MLFLGPSHRLPLREWPMSLFAAAAIGSPARRALLAGVLPDGPPPSPTICVCHGVSAATILAAVEAGAATRAGTGCGSCRPELTACLAKPKIPA